MPIGMLFLDPGYQNRPKSGQMCQNNNLMCKIEFLGIKAVLTIATIIFDLTRVGLEQVKFAKIIILCVPMLLKLYYLVHTNS